MSSFKIIQFIDLCFEMTNHDKINSLESVAYYAEWKILGNRFAERSIQIFFLGWNILNFVLFCRIRPLAISRQYSFYCYYHLMEILPADPNRWRLLSIQGNRQIKITALFSPVKAIDESKFTSTASLRTSSWKVLLFRHRLQNTNLSINLTEWMLPNGQYSGHEKRIGFFYFLVPSLLSIHNNSSSTTTSIIPLWNIRYLFYFIFYEFAPASLVSMYYGAGSSLLRHGSELFDL